MIWVRRAAWLFPFVAVITLGDVFPEFARVIQPFLYVAATLSLVTLTFIIASEWRVLRRLREHSFRRDIAEQILAQKQGCQLHEYHHPDPSCWTCARDGAFQRAALIASGKFGMVFPSSEDELHRG